MVVELIVGGWVGALLGFIVGHARGEREGRRLERWERENPDVPPPRTIRF